MTPMMRVLGMIGDQLEAPHVCLHLRSGKSFSGKAKIEAGAVRIDRGNDSHDPVWINFDAIDALELVP